MRYIGELSEQDRDGLEELHRTGSSHHERNRTHAILLSAKGFEIETLAVIFSVARNTVRDWLDRFEQEGISGMRDAPQPGRPTKLDDRAQALIAQGLQTPTPHLIPQLFKRLKEGAVA